MVEKVAFNKTFKGKENMLSSAMAPGPPGPPPPEKNSRKITLSIQSRNQLKITFFPPPHIFVAQAAKHCNLVPKMVVIFYSHFSFTFFASIILLLKSQVKNCKGECQIPTETGFIEGDLNGLSQEDSGLIEAIKSRLISPSKNRYNFSKPDVNVQGQFDQAIILAELFGDKTDGFFIEAG
jgi:hypothetical protein